MHLSPKVLGRADILNLDLEDRDENISLNDAANTVSYLISVYSVLYSAKLALALAHKLSDAHFVAVWDGPTILQAFLAEAPQTDPAALTGNALTILGSHSLQESVAEVLELNPTGEVRIGSADHQVTYEPDEERRLVRLAEEFPWYRKVLGLDEREASGAGVVDRAMGLGMPGVLIGMPD